MSVRMFVFVSLKAGSRSSSVTVSVVLTGAKTTTAPDWEPFWRWQELRGCCFCERQAADVVVAAGLSLFVAPARYCCEGAFGSMEWGSDGRPF